MMYSITFTRSRMKTTSTHCTPMMTRNFLVLLFLMATNLSFAGQATGTAQKNSLYQHASPYLAMHGRDPVRWLEWGKQAVNTAGQKDKLLFVSSGYFSCHWCHVMQRESFQNDKVAALLNRHFVPVKVDRELNSALDAHLIDFVERTQGQAGWPLNVFVTPDGYPLVGFTYVPAENFVQILTSLEKEWREKRAELRQLASSASTELSTIEVSDSYDLPTDLASGMMSVLVNQAFAYADELQGGYGQVNKFPSVPRLDVLLEIYKRKPDDQIKHFLNLTLQNMASQGLRDQLAGGFYRYVVDPNWQIPHFEKMLYDNALLASLYYKAADILNAPEYTSIANDTLDFILRDLNTESAAFAASLSAVDDKGVEGGYYLWDKNQLEAILDKNEADVVRAFWGVTDVPDLEDGHHLVQSTSTDQLAVKLKRSEESIASLLESARSKMLLARTKRILPKDNKVLTAWNGLTLTALTNGAQLGKDQKYRSAAAALVDYIHTRLWDDKSRQLYGAVGKDGPIGHGNLEDYAYIAQGLLEWWQLTKRQQDKQLLDTLLDQAWKKFYTRQGWQLAENMLLKYGAGQTMVSDGPLPSPSSVLIETTLRYAETTDNKPLRKQALRALNVGFKQLQSDAFWYASQIKVLMLVQK
jgi:uncharacterized protein YyaL (SSP411 family)